MGEWKKRMETTVTVTYGLELSRWVWNGGVGIGPMQLTVSSLPAKHYLAGLVLQNKNIVHRSRTEHHYAIIWSATRTFLCHGTVHILFARWMQNSLQRAAIQTTRMNVDLRRNESCAFNLPESLEEVTPVYQLVQQTLNSEP